MLWILFVLLNVFGNGSAIFLTKSAINKNPKLGYSGVMFVTFLFAVILYLPIFLFSFITHPVIFSNINGLYFLLASIVVTVSAFLIYVHALAINDLSVFGPLDSIRPFFVLIFSLLLLGQKPNSFLLFGVGLIFSGALVLTMTKKFFREVENFNKTFFVLASTALFGLGAVVDKKTLFYIDPLKYVFFLLLGICFTYGILYLQKHKRIHVDHFLSRKMVGIAALWVIGYIGIMIATKLSTPNHVVPLQMTRSLYLSLIGFLFLGEKGYVRKIFAAIIMLIGIFFITR